MCVCVWVREREEITHIWGHMCVDCEPAIIHCKLVCVQICMYMYVCVHTFMCVCHIPLRATAPIESDRVVLVSPCRWDDMSACQPTLTSHSHQLHAERHTRLCLLSSPSIFLFPLFSLPFLPRFPFLSSTVRALFNSFSLFSHILPPLLHLPFGTLWIFPAFTSISQPPAKNTSTWLLARPITYNIMFLDHFSRSWVVFATLGH